MIVAAFYFGGLVLGLLFTDGPFGSRLALALLWPLGPLAFLLTVSALTVAALIAFPIAGAIVAAAGALGWWVLR
jgi:hypothetical protein